MNEGTEPRRDLPTPVAWIDLAVLATLSLIGLWGFAATFANGAFILPGVAGLAIGAGAIVVARAYGFDLLTTSLFAIACYFLLGTPFTMPGLGVLAILPSGTTFSGLAIGGVQGWADIVTLTTPIEAPYFISVVPFAAAWIVGALTATAAIRWFPKHPRTPLASLVAAAPAIALYIATVLLGTDEPVGPVVRGFVFASILVLWIAWMPARGDVSSEAAHRALRRRRLQGVAVMLAIGLTAGTALGVSIAPPAGARFVLRENVQPPFDPRDFPSPLDAFRRYTNDRADDVMFTVEGLAPSERIRLAVMDTYDGQIWTTTAPGLYDDASGSFRLAGTHLSDEPSSEEIEREIRVSIRDYSGSWLPSVGHPTAIEFAPGADVPTTSLLYNDATGVLALAKGVPAGLTYTVTTTYSSVPSDSMLEGRAVATVNMPPISNVPDVVGAKAKELAGDATTPLGRLRNIEAAMRTEGFLSHGGNELAAPSSAGHGADRISTFLGSEYMIGDGEQYASAFALMAREMGYPARVVLGFAPSEGVTGGALDVTGADITAWVEVDFADVGWVPFDPTATNTEVPKEAAPQAASEPLPQVRQPPRSEPPQEPLASAVQTEEPKKDDSEAFVVPAWLVVLGKIAAVPILLYLLPVAAVAAIKSRRRRRRKSGGSMARRAAGAWDELVDTYGELGYSVDVKMTRVQLALDFEQQFSREVAARMGERIAAQRRADERADARRRRAEAVETTGTAASPLSDFLDATVLRAKHATAWRPGVVDPNAPLPTLPGLREIAVDVDSAVFSGEEIDDTRVDRVWTSATEGVVAARASVSWLRRRLSGYRLRVRGARRDGPQGILANLVAGRSRSSVSIPR